MKTQLSRRTGELPWSTALYIRLSREDGDKAESNSIGSQRALLTRYADEQPELRVYGEYVDDGCTGTNFDRPAFQRMLRDMETGSVNCVLVKDLSRFGRDYIQVGDYIENRFSLLGIRFITVAEGLDTFRNPDGAHDLLFRFRNLINDEYSRDISQKIRSALNARRRDGKFIGAFAAYGYLKSHEDHNRLIPDPQAAPVVQRIFAMFLSGSGVLTIARTLNREGIPNPTAYKTAAGIRTAPAGRGGALWSDSTVRRLLRNRVYCGDAVQGQLRKPSMKMKTLRAVPREEWIVVPDTHPPLVSHETFDEVQRRLSLRSHTAADQSPSLFAGLLFCADCKRAMHRKAVNGGYVYYLCSTYKQDPASCTKHSLRADRLEEAIREALQRQIDAAVSTERLLDDLRADAALYDRTEALRRERESLRREEARLRELRLGLYADWKNGDLTHEEYLSLRADYGNRIEACRTRLLALQDEEAQGESDREALRGYLACFTQAGDLTTLTRPLLCGLIDRIEVGEGNALTVRFRFAEEIARAAQVLQKEKHKEKI